MQHQEQANIRDAQTLQVQGDIRQHGRVMCLLDGFRCPTLEEQEHIYYTLRQLLPQQKLACFVVHKEVWRWLFPQHE